MASPQEMADYYDGCPDPADSSTWGGADNFDDAKGAFDDAAGPPPAPSPVPGAPSPGAGMPAARIGDICAHGGAVIGPGCPTVLIGNMPAVRGMPAMDTVACPMFNGVVPHATGTILKGSTTVMIGYMPAARVADPVGPPATCAGNQIAMGCFTVLIGDSGGGGGGGGGTAPPATAPTSPAAGAGAGGGGASSPATATTIEPAYAEVASNPRPPGESTQQVDTGTHWLEIEMVDEAEQPVPGERYVVRLPDSKEVVGSLDARGQTRITGIKTPGACTIRFPNLDLAAWERWRPGTATPASGGSSAGPPSSASEGPVPQGPPARVGTWRRVLQGECLSSIATDTGLFWQTIWDHASNAELKRRRGDPNVLLPGDAVFIPGKRPREETSQTDQRSKFRRKGEPAFFRVKLLENGEPLANAPYTVDIDGHSRTGTTDAQGRLECPIPPNARRGSIEVETEEGTRVYEFILGQLDPLNEISGVQQRLAHLGFDPGPIDGQLGPQTSAALRGFQAKHRLAATGEPDAATRTKLREEHGS